MLGVIRNQIIGWKESEGQQYAAHLEYSFFVKVLWGATFGVSL